MLVPVCSTLLTMFVGGMEMLDTEFDKWHDKQLKREESLKQVEDKVNFS